MIKEKLTFAGHDKFSCRQFWLKKGFDYVMNDQKFNDAAVIDLGVGRNMVKAVKYWTNAFGVIENDSLSNLSKQIFSEEGLDPFLEDIGTIWLLHYKLVTSKVASIYYLVFNIFRRQRIEFTKELLKKFLLQYCEKNKASYNESSIGYDIDVFIRNYSLPEKSQGIESDFSGLLFELDLLKKIERSGDWYKIENTNRPTIAPELILFCILYDADEESTTFSFRDLLEKDNSVGRVFCLNGNGLNDKLYELTKIYPENIVFTENAGVKVLQIKGELNCWDILKRYYEN